MAGQVFTPFAGYQAAGLQVVGEENSIEHSAAHGTWPSVLSPENPLFWGLALFSVTVGLIAVTGSVRLGRAEVKGSVGST